MGKFVSEQKIDYDIDEHKVALKALIQKVKESEIEIEIESKDMHTFPIIELLIKNHEELSGENLSDEVFDEIKAYATAYAKDLLINIKKIFGYEIDDSLLLEHDI